MAAVRKGTTVLTLSRKVPVVNLVLLPRPKIASRKLHYQDSHQMTARRALLRVLAAVELRDAERVLLYRWTPARSLRIDQALHLADVVSEVSR